MSLIKCSECGKDISQLAESCPSCGAPTPKHTARVISSIWNDLFTAIFGGFVVIIITFVIILFFIYGSISPCEILKKEVASDSAKKGNQIGYAIMGGYINRVIDTLSPLQCSGAIFNVWTGTSVDEVIKGIQ